MVELINLKTICAVVIFSFLGLIIQWAAFWLFDKLTPGELWKEIVEKHNMPLAITAGAMIIAISQIISAAIHG